MSHQLQIVSSTESSRATAYDSDTLSGGRCAFRWRNLAGIISRHTFQTTDVDRIIYDISAAASLTWMFTDETAGCRERIILADQTDRVSVASFSCQCDISRNINVCRTEGYARYRLCIVAGTASLTDMFFIIFTTVSQALMYHGTGFISDWAVRSFADGFGQCVDQIKCLHCSSTVHNICQKVLQLPQPDAARGTFSTGLCLTHLDKCTSHVNRT